MGYSQTYSCEVEIVDNPEKPWDFDEKKTNWSWNITGSQVLLSNHSAALHIQCLFYKVNKWSYPFQHLTIKEFYMKIIPHRLYGFCVRPSTKVCEGESQRGTTWPLSDNRPWLYYLNPIWIR